MRTRSRISLENIGKLLMIIFSSLLIAALVAIGLIMVGGIIYMVFALLF